MTVGQWFLVEGFLPVAHLVSLEILRLTIFLSLAYIKYQFSGIIRKLKYLLTTLSIILQHVMHYPGWSESIFLILQKVLKDRSCVIFCHMVMHAAVKCQQAEFCVLFLYRQLKRMYKQYILIIGVSSLCVERFFAPKLKVFFATMDFNWCICSPGLYTVCIAGMYIYLYVFECL